MILFGIGILFLACAILSMVVLIIRLEKKNRAKAIEKFTQTKHLLTTGIPIPLDLDTIRIKSNSWTEKQTIQTTIYDLEFDHNKTQTILEIETKINERKHVFHVPVKQNPQTLEMYFAIQKTTSLYINPENPEEFYLDLRFIPQ